MRSGPIETPMSEIPGNPSDLRGDNSGIFDGEPGYPKGDATKIPELTYDQEGAFGKVPTNHA